MSKNTKSLKHVSDSYLRQITVLRALAPESKPLATRLEREIAEIAEMSGLGDEKETQRYLYILEGHKLVSPRPSGDFTSKIWAITEDGMKAYRQIQKDFGL